MTTLMNPIIQGGDDANNEEPEIDLYSIYYKQNTTKKYVDNNENRNKNKIIFYIKKYLLCCFYLWQTL